MRIVSGEIILSPSDLMRFQGCAHATSLDLRRLRGEPLEPADDDPDAVVVQTRGDAHERAYLADLQDDRDVVSRGRLNSPPLRRRRGPRWSPAPR